MGSSLLYGVPSSGFAAALHPDFPWGTGWMSLLRQELVYPPVAQQINQVYGHFIHWKPSAGLLHPSLSPSLGCPAVLGTGPAVRLTKPAGS